MKVVILAGGFGTRLSEETKVIPKPMVEIGGKPILWHIMKIYSYYGYSDFIILTGYKSHIIKDYFIHYYQQYSDVTVDLATNTVEIHKMQTEPWKVTMLYTGQSTMTGGRIKKAQEYQKIKEVQNKDKYYAKSLLNCYNSVYNELFVEDFILKYKELNDADALDQYLAARNIINF